MTANKMILTIALLSLPLLAQAGDYQGGSGERQSTREGNTHSPGMGMEQGSLKSSLFEQLDKNHDKKLSGDELKAYDSGPDGKMGEASVKKNRTLLKNHDLNGDGIITLREFDKSNNAGQ